MTPAPAGHDAPSDVGRLGRIRDLCSIAGVPRLGLYLFEAGATEREATRGIARALGVLPPAAPFQALIDDPDPGNWPDV